jgi:hypothetical protein
MRVIATGWVLLGLLMGCSDGYPSKREVFKLHFQMTQQEAIDALNTIGSRPHMKDEWHYSLTDPCILNVSVSDSMLRQETSPSQLVGAQISVAKLDQEAAYSVILVPDNGRSHMQLTVMSGGTWIDASQVRWLLNYLPKFCAQGAG